MVVPLPPGKNPFAVKINNNNLYNCSCDYLDSFCVVWLYCVCNFVCCVSFDCGVILCDVCYLFVVSYCKPLPPGKNPFAVKINKIIIIIIIIYIIVLVIICIHSV
jgi:hypothetical protein